MKAIGLRAEKDAVHWALVEGTIECPFLLQHGRAMLPRDWSEPDSLCWLRREIHSLLRDNGPDRAAIRLSEIDFRSKAAQRSMESIQTRARIEGVLLEVCRAEELNVVVLRAQTFEEGFAVRPPKKAFRSADFSQVDWLTVKSHSRRQAIIAAGSVLQAPCDTHHD